METPLFHIWDWSCPTWGGKREMRCLNRPPAVQGACPLSRDLLVKGSIAPFCFQLLLFQQITVWPGINPVPQTQKECHSSAYLSSTSCPRLVLLRTDRTVGEVQNICHSYFVLHWNLLYTSHKNIQPQAFSKDMITIHILQIRKSVFIYCLWLVKGIIYNFPDNYFEIGYWWI